MKMRFPYFYQLMVGFLTVIIALMAVTSFSLLHFGRNQLLTDVERNFIHYAELIEEAKMEPQKLKAYEQMLENQQIEYGLFDRNGRLIHPKNHNDFHLELPPSDIEALKNDEKLLLRLGTSDLRGNKQDTAAVYIPIFENNQIFSGFVGVARPLSEIETYMADLRGNVVRAFIFSTVIAILISIIFSYFMVKRVNRLSKASQKVAAGDYDIYIDHSNRDEIDRLSADFNKMVKALKEWRREVLHLEERRKTFMQDAIHEMRTPLTTINGLLEGLEYGVFDEEQEMRSIKIMGKETKRLIRLVNENMDYENIQSNRIILRKHHFPLDEAIQEISAQLNRIARESNNEIIIEERVKEVSVYADFDRFKQVMVNLLKNALQFTSDGQITVDASETKEYTYITVSDTGIGMTEEQIKNIWDRYYKADPSRKNTKYGESGLGLPIVKRLVELHDGEISVESEIGKGSTFKLSFPRKRSAREDQ